MHNRLTSSEIAKLAGVSRSTVSRVINGYDNVPKATHDKVMQVIRKNNYHPQLSGQLLVGKKTGTLGFFWVKGTSNRIAMDELSSSYMVSVTELAAKMGYLMLTCVLENLREPQNIDWVNKIFMQGRIDAGIFIGVDNDEPLIESLITGGNIVGIFDHFHDNRTEHNRISVNYEEETGGKIIDYLYGLGHREIALILGNMNRYSSVKRRDSFLSAMKRNGIEIRQDWLRAGGLDETAGYQAAIKLLAKCKGKLPTAICANNDATAFGVYKALEEANINVPQEISVTGIDGHIRKLDPGLTTYAFDYQEVFTSLVSRTIAAVMGEENNPTTEFIRGKLVTRNSCKKI